MATTEMKILKETAYKVALGGTSFDDMAHALSEGYDKGRREYLDENPEVRAAIMAAPEPEVDECAMCGTDLNDEGPNLEMLLRQVAKEHDHN